MKQVLHTILFLAAFIVTESGGWEGSALPVSGGRQVKRASTPIGSQADKRSDEARAVAALVKLGVPLQRDVLGRVRWIEAAHGEFSDEALSKLPSLPMLEWLEIGGGKVTAAGMAHLKGCTALRRLYVHDVHVGNDALAILTNIPRLEALSLQHTGIIGKGLKYLKPGGTLRVLNLSGNEISDEDIAQVARFAGLEVLGLQDTKVSGAGLAKLEGMAKLNVLNLSNCRIADKDLEHFALMPNLRIVYAADCNLSDKAIEELNQKLPLLSIFP
jgi:hypothetical protein